MAKTVMSELVVRMTAETAALKAEMERVRRSVDTAAKNMSDKFSQTQKRVDSLAGGFKALGGMIAGIGFGAQVQKIGQVSDNIAMFERGVRVISPSLSDAGKSMEFVSRLAYDMGLGLQDVRSGFIDLAAATQGTVLAGEQTRKIFESVTRFGDLLGKSAEKIKLGFIGISQMATLQTVSMEETRQVMENLGVSMTTIAKSIGMTTQEYKDNVKAGKVMASELLPALAKEMDKLTANAGATARTFGAAWSRMANEWELFLNAVAQSGLIDQLASAFTALASAVKAATQPVSDFVRVLVSMKAEIATAVAALGTMFIISKVTAGFIALQAAIAGSAGVTAALASLNAVAAVAFGPAGWIALGVGLLAGLVIQMNALKGQAVQLVGALSQADRVSAAAQNIRDEQAKIIALRKEMDGLVHAGTRIAKNIIDQPRVNQILKDIKAAQESIAGWSQASGRWSADLAEGERKAAEESARLKKELAELNEEQSKAGKAAKDTRSELEKLNVPYAKLIEQYSELYGVAPKVTAAVMKAESAFKQFASSGKAYGLMQLIPSTFSEMLGNAATDIYNVNQNVEAGTKYLAKMLKQFGDLPKALAAYNAGPGRVMEAIKVAAKEGITWQEAFAKKFPGAWKETGPYIEKVIKYLTQFGEGKYEIDAMADAQKEAAEAAKLHDEALGRLDEALAGLEEQTRRYTDSVKAEAQATKDALLRAQDPEAYKEMIRTREQLEAQNLAGMYDQEAQAALQAKYAAEDLLEAYQVRQGWAQQVLAGFDSLWSNMISGAENAMEALQKTLKSWLYAIGNWLLKQTLIIPITAAMFGVSQQSLGGGLLGQLSGAGSTGGTSGAGGLSRIGSLFSSGGVAQGLNRFANWATGWANAGPQQNAIFGGANWGYGLAGAAGYYGGGALFGNKGYSGLGGSLGAMAGYGLTAAGTALGTAAVGAITAGLGGGAMAGAIAGSVVPVVGTIIGAVAGAALGSMFGGEKIKGGVGYYDFNRRRAGAVHGDTDPAVVEMMQKLGSTMEGLDKVLRSIQGFGDMWNFGASFQLDTDSAGRMDAAYNSYSRGLQKASFKAAEDAAKWFVEQMVQDVQKQFELHAADMGGLGAAITNIFKGLNAEQLEQELGNLAQALPAIMASFADLSQPLQAEVSDIARWHAKSLDDIVAMMSMAQDVQAGYAASLWDIYEATRNAQASGETLTAAYLRVVGQFKALQDAFLMFHGVLLPVTKVTLWWGDALAEAAGGLDNLLALQTTYFENFYTDQERLIAAQTRAQVDVDKFNATLGLMGEAAIDTRDELRKYIESLDLGSEAGMKAYVAALKLAEAILTLDPVTEAAADGIDEVAAALADILTGVNRTIAQAGMGTEEKAFRNSLADLENQYRELYQSAVAAGASEQQLSDIRRAAAVDMRDLFDATLGAMDSFESLVGAFDLVQQNLDVLRNWLSGLGYSQDQIAQFWEYAKAKFLDAGRALYDSLQEALQAAIQKTVDLKIEWEQWQLNLRDKIGRLGGGAGASPGDIWATGERMYNTYAQNWNSMDLQSKLNAVNTMIGMVDQWVSANEAAIDRALQSQIDAINAAADAQLEALNAQTDALRDQRDAIQENYDAQIKALEETLDGLEQWISLAESLQNTINSLKYSTANPIPRSAQLGVMSAEITRLYSQLQSASGDEAAELAEELQRLLTDRLQLAQELFQRPSPEYQSIYTETMQMLEAMQGAAQEKADQALAIQEEIKVLQERMADELESIDAGIKATEDAVEAQRKAIEQSRDAQIAAAQAAAEAQKKAIYDMAKSLYEQFGTIGDQVYQEMLKEAQSEVDLMNQQLAVLKAIYVQMVGIEAAYGMGGVGPDEGVSAGGLRRNNGIGPSIPIPSYQHGISYVPQDGLAYLHRGERVTPAENTEKIVIRIGDIHVHGNGDPIAIKKAVQEGVKDMLPYIKRNLPRN